MFERVFKGEAGNMFRGMATLLVGAGSARIVGLVSIPILARVYSPEDFGVLALYTAFIAVLVPIMTLRYVQAIPLPKTNVMAFNLFSVCFKLIVLFSVVLTVVLALFAESILGWFDMEALLPWWWLLVLGVAGTALYELFSLWATRKKDYKVIAKTQLAQSLIGNLVKIGLGLLAIKPLGLIVGQLLTQSAGVTSFAKAARQDFKSYLPKIKRSKESFVAHYYQEFVWYRLPSQFLMVLSVQAPVMMMAVLYSKEETGQLSFAIMALSLPVSLIGSAMAKAYYGEVAALGRQNIKKIQALSFIVQKKLIFIGLPVAVVAFFFSKSLFVFVFGSSWEVAGEYAEVLSPFLFLQFLSTPLVQVLNVIGSQLVFLLINLVRVAGLIVLFVVVFVSGAEPIDFVILLSILLCMFYFFQTVYVSFLMNKRKVAK